MADAADLAWLERATELGRRGWGRVHPNPMVGCVLVRDGERVAEAWHREFGGPHAEALALEEAGAAARGATAYVSLEPCRHVGKTPACTDALVRSGVARVVYGAADPSREAGGGGETLRAAGVEVEGPLFSRARARAENPAFIHGATEATPFVALKLAVSLDGRIASAPGRRTQLTGPEARREVHRLRAGFDAVVVGSTTARVDDPRLTVREPVPMARAPTRIVLDSRARLPSDAALFRDVHTAPVVVFVRDDAPESGMERLEAAGARVHPVPPDPGGRGVDLDAVLGVCHDTGLHALLCEGGGELAGSLLAADRVHRLVLFVAPRILGAGGVPAFPDAAGTPSPHGSGFAGDGPGRRTTGARGAVRWLRAGDPVAFGEDVRMVYDRVPPGETETTETGGV